NASLAGGVISPLPVGEGGCAEGAAGEGSVSTFTGAGVVSGCTGAAAGASGTSPSLAAGGTATGGCEIGGVGARTAVACFGASTTAGVDSFPGSCAAALSDSAGIAGASIKTVLGFLAPRFIKKFAV